MSGLIINSLSIGNEGSASVVVNANQVVQLNGVSGTISNLVVSSTGTLQLGTDDGANTFTIGAGTIESGGKLNLAGGTYKITGLSNSGTVVIDKGSADVVLNDLIGNSIGKYNHDAISNTPTGNLVINSGAKTLSGDITIANGGKVTLKGGTFGSSGASINKDICLGNDTVLAFEDIEAYISRKENNVSRDVTGQWEIGSGAKVHFTYSDVFDWNDDLNLKVLTGGVLFLDARQSVKKGSSIILAGGTINGEGESLTDNGHTDVYGLDFYDGGTITTIEDSLIATNVGGHIKDASIEFDVDANKTLTMTGNLVGMNSNSFTKSDAGTMVYSGDDFEQSLTISGGVFEYSINGDVTHTAGISGDGTLRKSGTGTLRLTSNNTTVAHFAVTSGKLVYTVAAGEKEHSSLSGTGGTFEKAGDGTLSFKSQNTIYTGKTTISGGKIVLDLGAVTNEDGSTTNSIYTLGGAVDGSGTLSVKAGTTLKNNSKTISSALELDGGDVMLQGGKVLSGNVTIKDGSTLSIDATGGSDHVNYSSAHTITIEKGGEFAIGANRETFGGWTLNLKGGTVSGAGATGDVGTVALDYHADSTINALAGESSIEANVGVRGGKTLTVDVSKDATLDISGNVIVKGNITKSSAGSLTFSGTSTFNNGITLNGGEVKVGAAATLKGTSTVAADSTLTVTSTGQLTFESGSTLELTTASSVLDLSDITYDDNSPDANVKLVTLMNQTSGAGTVKLKGGSVIQTRDTHRVNVNLSTNYVVGSSSTDSLTLTAWSKAGNEWRTWTVLEGGSLTVGDGAGMLNVRAGQQLIIQDGGIVKVGRLKLGHEAVENPGSVVMNGKDSQLTVSQFYGNATKGTSWNNVVDINGGTLTITGDTAFAINSGSYMDVSIEGGADSPVVLKTGSNDVLMSGDSTSLGGGSFKIANVTIDAANTNTITIKDATLGSGVVNNGKLALGGTLDVTGVIQNNGSLDIQGTVNWNLASTEGLTATYAESELTRTDNGLGAGVISGLITGNGTLVDNGNVAATVNDKTGTLATGTGLVTADGVVYYVMNTPKLDEPEILKEDRPGEVYSFANGKEVLISDVVHVGVHDRSDPEAAEGANTALGFYVGENGVLCIMGDSETMTAGEILASTQGSGDIILRTPGYQTDDMFPTDTITLSSKTNVTGNLYLSPYVRYEEQGEWARPQAGISLHLNEGADISSFSAVHLCHPQSVIMINGEIGKSDITGGHINNLTSSGASEVFLCFNKEANSEIILAGKTTIQGYDHGTVTSEDGTGNPLASNLYLDVNHEKVNIVIEELNGKQIDWWNTGFVTFSTGLSDNYGGEDLTSISGTLDINSFKYEGYVALMPVLENSTLHTNITLLEDEDEYEQLIDSQIYFVNKDLQINKTVEGDASLTIKGAGRYILSDGNSIDYSSWTGEYRRYNFGVLDSNWTGTVEVNNLDATIEAIDGIEIADYGNANSTIHFKGFKGYLTDDATAVEIKQDLILENTYKNDGSLNMNAYEITSGDTGQVQTYTGDISGTGDFVVSAAENMTFNLQGNLSEWKDGAELKVTAGTQAVNFSDSATVINADVLATNGATMNADISNTESVTVNGKVKADGGTLNLNVNTAKGTTTFTNEVNVTKISVGADSTAKLKAASSAGNVSIGSYGEGIATLSNGLTIEENTVGHGHIADTMISQIQKAGRVELVEVTASNLYLYGNQVQFHSTDSTNQFKFDKQIPYGSERVNEVVFTSDIFSGMILSEDGAQLTLTVNDAVLWGDAVQADWTNVTIKLEGFTIEQLAGTAGDWDWKKFGLSFDSNSASVATLDNAALSTTVYDLLNADYEFVKYEQSADGLIIRMYNTPEPTTATLSMLALAALAARRRRASR
ncbi:MAG: hypothetical protein IJA81_01415 [Akkermansia sp.]|nr:hypothetical protein [Akkermansia sp.]